MSELDARAWCEKGLALVAAEKYDEALKCFDCAIDIAPSYERAYNYKGNVLLILGRIEEATECYNIATTLSPSFAEAWSNKGDILLLQDEYAEALACFDRVTELDPNNENAWLIKGILFATKHKFRKALRYFNRALQINPKSAEARKYKAEALECINIFGETPEPEELKAEEAAAEPERKLLRKKICVIGDPTVGKTSLIQKYVYDIFDDKYLRTMGVKITEKNTMVSHPVTARNTSLKLMIWDIGGQKIFENVHSAYYKGADGAFAVCDVTRKHTLSALYNWIDDLYKITGKIPIIIIGNKIDRDRNAISENDYAVKRVANSFNVPHLLTSAKTGDNVENAFTLISQLFLKDTL